MAPSIWRKIDLTAVSEHTTIFWLRRDLRLADNAGLFRALKEQKDVLPVFIFDTEILDKLEDKIDARVEFILQSLETLKQELESHGTSLLVLSGNPIEIFKKIDATVIYTNHDYEPYARKRDESISKIIHDNGGLFKSFKDQVIFEKNEVLKGDGLPYTVFTPYSRKWKSLLTNFCIKSYPTETYVDHFAKCKPLPFPTLKDIGFKESEIEFPPRIVKKSIIKTYDKTRDYPAIEGTTRLSIHLRFGTVSIRKLVHLAKQTNQTWLNELIWREFYQMILWHFPHIVTQSFKPAYDRIPWRNDEREFKAWCDGQTGYPIVDAGMRELNETGFMHNRVRMIVASFLTKHLLIDWRWGEAYFGKKLMDYDLAANNGGWQWSAGTGCDAAPYFRVFNPYLQTEKFDPDLEYIRYWVPEKDTSDYPKAIVEHAEARDRALRTYKNALDESR
ncbi:MAG: deoxyribodipyrimidine photo-lyase [Chryseolinea sp.]